MCVGGGEGVCVCVCMCVCVGGGGGVIIIYIILLCIGFADHFQIVRWCGTGGGVPLRKIFEFLNHTHKMCKRTKFFSVRNIH